MSRLFPRPYQPTCITLTKEQQVKLEAWRNKVFGPSKPGVDFHAWTERGYDMLVAVCRSEVLDLTIQPKDQ